VFDVSKEPRVTFVVPCYNYGRFLAKCVDSLLGQTFQELEIIIIDDASTDETGEVLKRYEGDARVKIVRHASNQGNICTFNEGISMARGEYVGLLSADDYCLRTDAVARQVAAFDAHLEVGFVYGAFVNVDAQGKQFRVGRPWPTDYVMEGPDEFSRMVSTPRLDNYVPASGTLVRRRCHDEVGLYDERLRHTGDWELWLRLAARYSVAYIAEPLFAYHWHGENMSLEPRSAREKTLEMVLTARNAFAALPANTPPQLRARRRDTIALAALNTCWHERHGGRVWGSWEALAEAVRQVPWLPLHSAFYGAVARNMALTLFGQRLYSRLINLRNPAPDPAAGGVSA
jgi:glycosyltransferase involved in cell wall biosynthesis